MFLQVIYTRRYGLLCGPTSSSCGGPWPLPEAFFALWAKKVLIMLFWPILGHFWCSVLTLLTECLSVPNLGADGHICPFVPILGMDEQISKNLKI